ncbi:MAG: peptidoglycan editing factor PgeF [Chromatiales bacterium]|nr:peptidoglycan editing factor PgeF [Chromatiales bacterium]
MNNTHQADDYFADGFLWPNWPLPKRVKACITTRLGGHSLPPYDEMNLALHVGDDPLQVLKNRNTLKERLNLPTEPAWLEQVHGNQVVVVEKNTFPSRADAAISFESGRVCAVMVADCLPVLFCNQQATRVGVAHAGWRGLAAGIIENTVAALNCAPAQLYAFLGPAIGADAYRVGDEVRDAFISEHRRNALCFLPDNCGAWMANLYQLARLKLQRVGVTNISGGSHCTYYNRKHFFSYRRDAKCGRMAALIYLQAT